MRVAMIGLGAVGATVLTSIDPRHSVTAVVRGDHGRAIKARGISVTGAMGAHKIKVHALAKLPLEKFDAVVVAVKAHEIFSAIQSASLQSSTPIIVIANGIGALAEARRAAPRNPIALGLAMFGANIAEPGRVDVTYTAPLVIGGDVKAVDTARTVIGPSIQLLVGRDIDNAVWSKLLVNELNAIPAITGFSVQETIANKWTREIVTRAMREAARVHLAEDDGRFPRIGPIGPFRARILASGPWSWALRVPVKLVAKMGSVPNFASTHQSIARGRQTEIDFLAGAVVRVGSRYGIPTPVNRTLVSLVHEVEETGRFYTLAEIKRRFPL
ncbi:MAG: ketopantoate reductase family protein [Microbacteriaceae bacterium]